MLLWQHPIDDGRQPFGHGDPLILAGAPFRAPQSVEPINPAARLAREAGVNGSFGSSESSADDNSAQDFVLRPERCPASNDYKRR